MTLHRLYRTGLAVSLFTSGWLFAEEPVRSPEASSREIRLTAATLETTDGSRPAVDGITVTPPESAEFVPLITGDALDGWVIQEGRNGSWRRENDDLSCVSAGGGWLRTEKEFSDFILKLEYRLQPGGNSGIGLRCPSTGNPTFTGIEVQLLDDQAEKYADLRPDQYTGSIYYQVPGQRRAQLKPYGEWNSCEIRCVGDYLQVWINGDLINAINLAKTRGKGEHPGSSFTPANRPPSGHIALQSHSTRVDFRNIRIQDLTVHTPSGLKYVDLLTGEGETVTEQAKVTVHYFGQLMDGKRFGDSRDLGRPVTVALQDVIPGWQEGIQGMRAGGRRRLIVPPDLAYGEQGVGTMIPPNATLVFEVELCAFEGSTAEVN